MSQVLRRVVMMMAKVASGVTYATWDPANKSANVTLTGSNLVATTTARGSVKATLGKSSGKWYWEFVCSGASFGNALPGVANASELVSDYPGFSSNSVAYFNDGRKFTNSVLGTYGDSYLAGDNIGVALDATAGTVTFYKNGVSQGAISGLTGTIYPMAGGASSAIIVTANFGATAFAYTPPAGYNAGLY